MSKIIRNRARKIFIVAGLALFVLQAGAQAATKVAVIDEGFDSTGTIWCSFLNDNGYECTLFPPSGPTTTLNAFTVVIDMSEEWADPGHTLADFLQTGKGVITWGWAPFALGIDSDPVVQAWIGANDSSAGTGYFVTTATDSILGDRPPGTLLGGAGDCCANAIDDTVGHSDAKVLVRFVSGTCPSRKLYPVCFALGEQGFGSTGSWMKPTRATAFGWTRR